MRCIVLVTMAVGAMGCAMRTEESSNYYPLNPGRSWMYQVTVDRVLDASATLALSITAMPQRGVYGRNVTPLTVDLGQGPTLFLFILADSTGIAEYARQDAAAVAPGLVTPTVYYLRNPLQQGITWDSQIQTSVLSSLHGHFTVPVRSAIESVAEDVTVTAGTFARCIRVVSSGSIEKDLGNFLGKATITVEQVSWYAPDVGLVRSVLAEKSNHLTIGSGTMTMELQSYKK